MLLLYVGYGDSKRTYEQIHIEKITTNGQLVQNSIEKFLRDGLPLRQFAGFNTIAAPYWMWKAMTLMSVTVLRPEPGARFSMAIDKTNPKLPDPPSAHLQASKQRH